MPTGPLQNTGVKPITTPSNNAPQPTSGWKGFKLSVGSLVNKITHRVPESRPANSRPLHAQNLKTGPQPQGLYGVVQKLEPNGPYGVTQQLEPNGPYGVPVKLEPNGPYGVVKQLEPNGPYGVLLPAQDPTPKPTPRPTPPGSPTTGFKDHQKFEPNVMPKGQSVAQLPPQVTESSAFKSASKELALAFSKGDLDSVDKALQKVPAKLHEAFSAKGVTATTHLALVLGDGKVFMDSLLADVRAQLPRSDQAKLDFWTKKPDSAAKLEVAYGKAVTQLGDSAKTDAKGQLTLKINGHTYTLAKKLGEGQFGDLQLFTSKGQPDLVVKIPKVPDPLPKGMTAEDIQLKAPATEGRALVNALGTGAQAQHIVPLVSAIHTESGELLLVLGKAEHGDFRHGMNKIDKAVKDGLLSPQEAVPLKLAPMYDATLGLLRLQAAKGEQHFDVALRNILIDAQGRGLLADFGLTEMFASGAPIDGAQLAPPDGKMSIKWSSPEALMHQPIGPKSDSWMLGMMLHEVVYPEYNYSGDKALAPFPRISNMDWVAKFPGFDAEQEIGPADPQLWPDGLDLKLRALIVSLLQEDPEQRADLNDVLNSDVFKALGFGGKDQAAIRLKLAETLQKDFTPAVEEDDETSQSSVSEGAYALTAQNDPKPLNSSGELYANVEHERADTEDNSDSANNSLSSIETLSSSNLYSITPNNAKT
jgi:serine/threonine protein kinase